MERDCESELSKLNIEQNACIYHFGASVIHGQRSNILRLPCKGLSHPLHSYQSIAIHQITTHKLIVNDVYMHYGALTDEAKKKPTSVPCRILHSAPVGKSLF